MKSTALRSGHMQVNKSNENYYLSDDTVSVADGRRPSVKSCDWRFSTSKNFAVMMAGSGLKSAQRKRLHYCANRLPCIEKGIDNANKFNSSIQAPT
jgi:hypothetical protein